MLWVVAIATLALATQIAVVWAILHSSGGPLLMQEAMVTTERDGGRVLVFMERRLLSLSVGASSMIDAHPTWYEKEVLAREAMPTTYKALMHRLGVAANRPQSEWPDLAAWSGFPFPAMGFADNGGQWVGIGEDNPLHHIGIPTLVRWPAFVGNIRGGLVVRPALTTLACSRAETPPRPVRAVRLRPSRPPLHEMPRVRRAWEPPGVARPYSSSSGFFEPSVYSRVGDRFFCGFT